MAIYFTADTHFGHANIIKFCGRPYQNKAEHDEALIDNWNSIINKHDQVYHLGDFGFGRAEELRKIADRLHGSISLIKGNHDKCCSDEIFLRRFNWIKDYHLFQKDKYKIVLFHYAQRTWHFSNHGGMHLFGHSHGNLEPHGLSFDVGVDYVNKIFGQYRPISFDEVIQYMSTLTLQLDYDPTKKKGDLSD